MKTKTTPRALALLSGLMLGGSAAAATWTFNNTATNTQGGVTATASAWGSTANGISGTNTVLDNAFLTFNGSSGLGVKNNDCGTSPCTGSGDTNEGITPEHAIDNDQRRDAILFSFSGDEVNLSSINVGWVSGDSDFSVYAFTGAGTPSPDGVTYTDSAMALAGWELVGHFGSNASTGTKAISDATPVFSSYWLIGALNTASVANDYYADAFKLLKVTGTTCTQNPGGTGCGNGTPNTGVPEPGTLLLLGAGFLGLTRMTRRRAA